MLETNRFIEVFGLAARQAGHVARYLQDEISLHRKTGEKSPEGEALTAVDLAAQDVILSLLYSAFPESAVDTEEDTDMVNRFPSYSPGKPLIVVDPIDGTLNYSRGSREYAVMGALLEKDVFQAVLINFPAFHEIYRAERGAGCRKENTSRSGPLKIGSLPRRVRVTPGVPEKHRSVLQEIGYEVVVSRCSAVDASAPVTGKAAAALSLGRPSRRRAIGYLLTTEAGGAVRIGDRWWNGEDPLSLPAENQVTVVAGDRGTAEQIAEALSPLIP
jgi:fructose-1,6-bisphosphatase/inositol monophosphatase family enzyme